MSQSLAQMSDYITKRVIQFDSASLAACKLYLDRRYRKVWDDFFWADTQMLSTASLLAGNNTFDYPADMDRITTIRSGPDIFLDPITQTFLIESYPTIFEEQGVPKFYDENTTTPQGYAVTVYPTPSANINFLLFGKRKCPGLTADSDVSLLRNCDDAIIAFATADMLERQRQYGKAQSKVAEAMALVQEAIKVEQQQANQPRATKMLTVVGNSLLELSDSVAGICDAWTPQMTILIHQFLRRNYQALYDLNLWPESIVAVRLAYTTEQVIMPEYVDKVIGIRGDDELTLQPAEPSLYLGVKPSIFEETGSQIGFSILTPVGVATLPPAAEALAIASTSANDTNVKVFVRGESGGFEVTEEVTLDSSDGTTPVLTQNLYDVPLTIAKPQTKGDLVVNGATSSIQLQTILAKERERKHIRLWLLPPPLNPAGVDATVRYLIVLGKRKIKPLLSDEDTPIITGCQQTLISAAAADLFSRMGKADLAQEQRAKADASAKVLTQLHTDQSAYTPRFVPKVEPYAFTRDGGWGIW